MGMIDASAPGPSGAIFCNPFKWDILYSFLIKNYVVVFLPSTPAKWISSRNHKYRKVVGGKHNVVVLYVDASAPNPSGVVLCNPFIWDILYSFLIKNHVVVFVPSTPAKWISFCNHRNRKFIGGKNNVLIHYVDVIAPNPSGVVLCNPFKWDILYSFLIKNHVVVFLPSTPAKWISSRIPEPKEQKSCRRQTQSSSTLCEC